MIDSTVLAVESIITVRLVGSVGLWGRSQRRSEAIEAAGRPRVTGTPAGIVPDPSADRTTCRVGRSVRSRVLVYDCCPLKSNLALLAMEVQVASLDTSSHSRRFRLGSPRARVLV